MATNKTERIASMKNDRVYVRLNADIKDDFEKVAAFRGLTTSAMLHSFIVRTVHETRLEHPDLFAEVSSEYQSARSEKPASLSEKLVAEKAKKSKNKENTFTTGDGKTIPLVDEGEN